jgi:hypothetical protein
MDLGPAEKQTRRPSKRGTLGEERRQEGWKDNGRGWARGRRGDESNLDDSPNFKEFDFAHLMSLVGEFDDKWTLLYEMYKNIPDWTPEEVDPVFDWIYKIFIDDEDLLDILVSFTEVCFFCWIFGVLGYSCVPPRYFLSFRIFFVMFGVLVDILIGFTEDFFFGFF